MTEDHADMVAVVAHVARIAKRRASCALDARIAMAPELVALLCGALELDQEAVANDARAQIAAMERPQ